MKKIILLLSLLIIYQVSIAQNAAGKSDDVGRIALATVFPDLGSRLTPEAMNVLKNKLNQITTKYGLGGSSLNQRFIITANVIELTKDITASTPVIYVYNLEVTLYIGDGIEGTKFASLPISLKGAGNSETKAYLAALKELKPQDSRYADFLNEGKNKIIEYYNSKCDFIIKEAETMAAQNDFDGAIFKLVSVPDVCKDCYEKCMDKTAIIFKAKMERECQANIAKSKTLKTQENYNEAAEVLSTILPDLSCYPEAQALMTEINDHKCAVALGNAKGAWASKDIDAASNALKDIPSDSKCYTEASALAEEVRAWVKQKDNREWNFKMQEHKDKVDISKATIKAARDIGVAYGNNQPKSITYNVRGWY